MDNKILAITDVAAWQLCCGCGACAGICPDQIEMFDALNYGRRPRFLSGKESPSTQDAMAVCPGIELTRLPQPPDQLGGAAFYEAWGPVLGLWEGHAANPDIRFEGSSGGAATALALFAMEHLGMKGTLHTRDRQDVPYLNQTAFSTSRTDLLAGAGSRYAPASPCDKFGVIERAEGPCVFIGKPCDVAAVHKAKAIRPQLDEKLGLTIAFFCAGTPSTAGTLQMLRHMGIDRPESLKSLRYRGRGWPGNAVAEYIDPQGNLQRKELTYDQSWGDILQKYRQWRCYICPDHIGEYADIAVADAWHRDVNACQPGMSVLIARSARGLKILQAAEKEGALTLTPSDPRILPQCMPWQINLKAQLWARLSTLKLMNIPVPLYEDFCLYSLWRSQLGLKDKIRSLLGTAKRVHVKKLGKPRTLSDFKITAL